jgi:hypothetical protein
LLLVKVAGPGVRAATAFGAQAWPRGSP